MKYCENCGKELVNGVCPNCNGGTQNNNNIQSQNKTNAYSIVGFVLSFFISIAGLIVSIIGLKKSKEMNNGKGLSIAGIVISIVGLVFKILIIAIAFLGFFFAVSAYPEMKDAIEDAVEDNVSDWDYDEDPINAETSVDENGNTYYYIDLTNYQEDDEETFKIGDNYKVKININDIEEYNYINYNFDMYINDKAIDTYIVTNPYKGTLQFYLVNDKMICTINDDASYNIYIIDNNKVSNINKSTELYITNYKIESNKLLVNFSKFDGMVAAHLFFDGKIDEINYICDASNRDVIAEYTNEYDLSTNILSPIVTNQKTLSEYLTENNITCNN